MRQARRGFDLRRGYDWISRRAGRRTGDLWNQTRPHGAWQSNRRRIASRRVRRARRNYGSTFARRSCLPGRDALRKSARNGGRPRAIAGPGTNQWMEIAGRTWRTIRTARARGHRAYKNRHHISPHWFNVLFVLCPGPDSRSRQRAAERLEDVCEVFPRLLGARRLFRAVAIRDRIYFHSAYARRHRADRRSHARSAGKLVARSGSVPRDADSVPFHSKALLGLGDISSLSLPAKSRNLLLLRPEI